MRGDKPPRRKRGNQRRSGRPRCVKKKCEFEQKKNDAEKTLQTVSSLMSAYESKLPANLRSKKVIMEEE